MRTAQESSRSSQRIKRVLIVTPSFPYPPHGGAELRYYHLIKRLCRWYKISLVTLTPTRVEDRFLAEMREYCEDVRIIVTRNSPRWRQLPSLARLLISGKPFSTKYYNEPLLSQTVNEMLKDRSYDILQVEHSVLAGVIGALKLDQSCNTRTVLTFHNIDYLRDRSILAIERRPYDFVKTMMNRISIKAWERAMSAKFDACIAVSPDDHEALQALGSNMSLFTLPNGVDSHELALLSPAEDTRGLLFVGDCNYLPNREGISWFYKHIFAALQDSLPEIRLTIVGKGSDKWLSGLAHNPRVSVTGYVENIVGFYEEAAISVVPLRAGGGTRLKILEAMALGRPVVSTPIGCQGLSVNDGEHILIAEEPESFAKAVIKLLHDPLLRQRLIINGRKLVVRKYDWGIIAQKHSELYEWLVRPETYDPRELGDAN